MKDEAQELMWEAMKAGQLDEERVDALERIDGPVRTVAIRVPGTNTYLADGVWTHNDAKSSSESGLGAAPSAGSSGPGISESGGGTGPSVSGTGSGRERVRPRRRRA